MTDLVYDYITMGVDMILSSAILSAIVVMLYGSSALSHYSAMQQQNADSINYYMQYSMYDNTSGNSSSAVISALQYYKNDILVYVNGNYQVKTDPKTGKFQVKKSDGTWREASYDEFSTFIPSNTKYHAYICEDGVGIDQKSDSYKGGVITGIYFIKE